MANPNGVILSGLGQYSKVQSFELRAFTPAEPQSETSQVVQKSTIEEIKEVRQDPKTDQFPIETLKIPDDIEDVIAKVDNAEDDGNSSDPSE